MKKAILIPANPKKKFGTYGNEGSIIAHAIKLEGKARSFGRFSDRGIDQSEASNIRKSAEPSYMMFMKNALLMSAIYLG